MFDSKYENVRAEWKERVGLDSFTQFMPGLGLNGLETGDAGIRTRARFQPVYALVQGRTR